jgi:ribonuclease HII
VDGALAFDVERSLWRRGITFIAGVDEVGRGPLAGPVVAGAVVLHPGHRSAWLSRVRDSKQLAPKARSDIAACIWDDAVAASVAFVSERTIDRIGIAEAARQAMIQAVGDLQWRPHHLIIDAFRLPACSIPQTAIIRGDSISPSVACASIIAKVARDRFMEDQDALYPEYGFRRNKGYATRHHLEALRRLGPSLPHRRSFAPIREMVAAASAV